MNLHKKKCSTNFTIENLGWFPNDYLLHVNNAQFVKDFFCIDKPWSNYNIRFQIYVLRSDIHFSNQVLIFSMHNIYAFNNKNLLFSMHILDVLHPMENLLHIYALPFYFFALQHVQYQTFKRSNKKTFVLRMFYPIFWLRCLLFFINTAGGRAGRNRNSYPVIMTRASPP